MVGSDEYSAPRQAGARPIVGDMSEVRYITTFLHPEVRTLQPRTARPLIDIVCPQPRSGRQSSQKQLAYQRKSRIKQS